MIHLPDAGELPHGGIVGRATLAGCVTRSTSVWFFGVFGFELRDAEPLPFIPLRGQLNFFDVPDDVTPRIREQLR